nr:MAG TPA: BssC/TutF protein [Caudoviricetes sp.]
MLTGKPQQVKLEAIQCQARKGRCNDYPKGVGQKMSYCSKCKNLFPPTLRTKWEKVSIIIFTYNRN